MSRSSLRGGQPHPFSSMTRMGTCWSTSPCSLIHRALSWNWCHGANGKRCKRIGVTEFRLLRWHTVAQAERKLFIEEILAADFVECREAVRPALHYFFRRRAGLQLLHRV